MPAVDPEELHTPRSDLDFPVVGLGASAGGLAALERFFENMPTDPGMAFVIVLHLSPKHESVADRILQRTVRMPVIQVHSPTPLEKNHVYVISPKKNLSMVDGYLRVDEAERPRGQHVAIDHFFRTLAQAHREKAMAVVLSGMGADGSAGISRLREMGGIAFAQAPADAEYDQMPRAAIATGMIDFVLPVAELADKLVTISRKARHIVLPDAENLDLRVARIEDPDQEQRAEDALREIMTILRAHTGHDFRHYKRATVLRRIERRMQVNGVEDIPSYRDFLSGHPDERPALLQDMLISVTNFFRDRDAFESLERTAISSIFENRHEPDSVRVWSAGCATGEEAYSIAMLLAERQAASKDAPGIQLFATDIDDRAIAVARNAVYPAGIVPDIAPSRLSQFFIKQDDRYRVQKGIRDRVLFARHNVLHDPPFSKLDLVTCRNLLIYLNRDVQRDVLEMFHFALKPGGYLFLGTSESADAAGEFFAPVDKKSRLFRANTTMRSAARFSSAGRADAPIVPNLSVSTESKREWSVSEYHRQALAQYAPPSLLVGRDYNIAHMTEEAGQFLRHAGGAPSSNLLTLIVPDLRLSLRTALFQASQSNEPVDVGPVEIKREGTSRYVSILVRPTHREEGKEVLFLVLFSETRASGDLTPRASDEANPVIQQLENELRRTREHLQTTIEQSETSSEELKASNEELQSINEELRSATEELETSKEELQSINEELITVNHELKMKVEETSKVNDDLQNLIASTDIATVFIDRGMCIKRYTPRAIDVFSIIPADIGRSLMDITHRLDYDDLLADAAETFQSLRTIEREVSSTDGHWYIMRILPYRTVEDRIDGAILTFVDITRRRLAEDEVRKNEERMRLVADSTLDYAIITFDLDGTIRTWNKGAERIFGHFEQEAVGKSGELIFTADDRSNECFKHELATARLEGRALDDRWHVRKDGRRIYCSGITTPLIQGGLHGFAKIARDVTQHRNHERERENLLVAETASREAAQQANQLKDEFLAVMSHELKHPLNLILMNAELLSRLSSITSDEQGARAADSIRRTVLSQAQIIDDLLDLSRANTGKLRLKRSEVNFSDCVRRIVAAVASTASGRDIAVNLDLPATDVMVSADCSRLDQVVWNLLGNAMKFTPAGGRVDLSLAAADDDATLVVSDTGVGMTPQLIGSIFDMFQQGNSRTTRETGGLGIGLALVRQLVEAHGGNVLAESPGPGQGATFTVTWPVGAAAEIDRGAADEPLSFRGMRLLVVDDSHEILETFQELLTLEGALVSLADSADAALDALRKDVFDVLISDIGMPGTDGYELVRKVRELKIHDHIPMLALTGFGRESDEQKAIAAGFDAHVAKPVSLPVLLGTIGRIRRKKGRSA